MVIHLPRQSSSNGRIKKYEIYVSNDKTNWGDPVHSGEFAGDAGRKTIAFTPVIGKYLKLKSLSEQNDNSFTSISEIDVTGCLQKDITSISNNHISEIDAYPIPAADKLNISLPGVNTLEIINYQFYSISSSLVKSGSFVTMDNTHSFNVADLQAGTYLLLLKGSSGNTYRIKLIKN